MIIDIDNVQNIHKLSNIDINNVNNIEGLKLLPKAAKKQLIITNTKINKLESKSDSDNLLIYLSNFYDNRKMKLKRIKDIINKIKTMQSQPKQLKEISAGSSGAVEGGGILYKYPKTRDRFLKEMIIREYIRKNLKKDSILLEGKAEKKMIYQSTGLNVLNDLLNQIIEQIENGYKQLTTDPKQRQGYRIYLISNIKKLINKIDNQFNGTSASKPMMQPQSTLAESLNNLATRIMTEILGEEEVLNEPSKPEDAATFMPTEKVLADKESAEKESEPLKEEDKAIQELSQGDQNSVDTATAQEVFDAIASQIVTSYGKVISNKQDKQDFVKYFIGDGNPNNNVGNLQLYMDKWEGELASVEKNAGLEGTIDDENEPGFEMGTAEE